jgi:hypothetical protein
MLSKPPIDWEVNGVPITDLVYFIKDIASNYDCDEDAHRYNTICRQCSAQELIKRLKIRL